jgi:hypothetical protein
MSDLHMETKGWEKVGDQDPPKSNDQGETDQEIKMVRLDMEEGKGEVEVAEAGANLEENGGNPSRNSEERVSLEGDMEGRSQPKKRNTPEEVTTMQEGRVEMAEASWRMEKWGNPSQNFHERTGAPREVEGKVAGGGAKSREEDEESLGVGSVDVKRRGKNRAGNESSVLASAGGLTGGYPEDTPAKTFNGSQEVERPEGEGQGGIVLETNAKHPPGKGRQDLATTGGQTGVCPEEGAPATTSGGSRGLAPRGPVPRRGADGKVQTEEPKDEQRRGDRDEAGAERQGGKRSWGLTSMEEPRGGCHDEGIPLGAAGGPEEGRQDPATTGGLTGVCPEEGAPRTTFGGSRGQALLRLVPRRGADGKVQTVEPGDEQRNGDREEDGAGQACRS